MPELTFVGFDLNFTLYILRSKCNKAKISYNQIKIQIQIQITKLLF